MTSDELKASRAKAGCIMLPLTIPASAWAAYVGVRLWAWFAEPIGAPHITIARALGLGLLITMYTARIDADAAEKAVEDKTGGEVFWSFVVRAVVVPAAALGAGWMYAQFL